MSGFTGIPLTQYKKSIKTANCTSASPISLFTVTGDVVLKVIGVVKTALTTSDAITVSVGVSGDTNAIINSQADDATTLTQNTILRSTIPAIAFTTIEPLSSWSEYILSNGQDIILTTTGTVTAGSIDFYCFWYPLSSNGSVISA